MVTLLGWTGLLVFALESGGRDYGWGSPMIVGCLVGSVVLLVAFFFIERHTAAEPLIPFDLFKIPAVLASNAIGIATGMVMFGTLSFLPLFVQVVNQSSATQAGRILTPMLLAMVVASPIAARLILKVGYRFLCGGRVRRSRSSERSCSALEHRHEPVRDQRVHGVHRFGHRHLLPRHASWPRRTRSISRAWAWPPAS